MKFLSKSLLALTATLALVVAPQASAKSKIDIAIFKAKLTTVDFTLTAPSGGFVTYSSVTAKVDKRGKLKGTALRFDSVSGLTIPVTITGKIKGKAKLKGAGAERYAYAKGIVTFSDGATGAAEFASRRFPKGSGEKSAKLSPSYLAGLFAFINLVLGGESYAGEFFFFQPK
jgi:hypothetical protein